MANIFGTRINRAKKRTDKALAVFKKAQVQVAKETEALNKVLDDIELEIAELRKTRDEVIENTNKNYNLLDKFIDILGLDD